MVGKAMISLAEINAMTRAQFISTFGDVAEHSPWIAAEAANAAPFQTREDVIAAFEKALRSADQNLQLALIRAHPDLASKAKLTDDSNREQQGAGLTSLSNAEMQHFTTLNDAYKAKFEFPFIFAVKGATKQQILASFEERIQSEKPAEFSMALTQVMRIFRFRIEDRVA
jgi:2-oxo-4-hydroxy-4-carboxy-5-ureidoimidazoline decarboxylase